MNRPDERLILAMIRYDEGDPQRIQHFIKVYTFATLIAGREGIDPNEKHVLETAAIVHDIGIHVSEEKYGSSNGKYQEQEGPAEAEKLLRDVGGYSEDQISRVKYLVGHHHTYDHIDGDDYQILVEADFLVNIYEDQLDADAVKNAEEKIFRTETGLQILHDMFRQ